MRVQAAGSNRALARFDHAAMAGAVGGGTVLSATLRLTIVDNGNNWGPTGRAIAVHSLLVDWAEGNGTETDRGSGAGATWACAVDSDIGNLMKNCGLTTTWTMGQPNSPLLHPWTAAPTDTRTITSGQAGVVEFDVTADVVAFLAGPSSDHGWIVKKSDEGSSGSVTFGTRESSSPQLVITYMA